ncbi:MAG: zinc-ribbon domain-containing protein [Deltaproteobacteria bacterium]|nr:zinc-ribbon domain-containing protein [Deltaproteobacteria bacterium]
MLAAGGCAVAGVILSLALGGIGRKAQTVAPSVPAARAAADAAAGRAAAALPRRDAAPAPTQAPQPRPATGAPTAIHCTKCGREYPATAKFCPGCGADNPTLAADAKPKPKPKPVVKPEPKSESKGLSDF